MKIYDPTLEIVALIPPRIPASLIMRHSARYPIMNVEETLTVPLTPNGVLMAEELGQHLALHHSAGRLTSSPVGRCIETTKAIARGSGWQNPVEVIEEMSFEFIAPDWGKVQPGKNPQELPPTALQVMALLLELPTLPDALNVNVTHDGNLLFMARCFLNEPISEQNWPGFLQTMAVWREDGRIRLAWRGQVHTLAPELQAQVENARELVAAGC